MRYLQERRYGRESTAPFDLASTLWMWAFDAFEVAPRGTANRRDGCTWPIAFQGERTPIERRSSISGTSWARRRPGVRPSGRGPGGRFLVLAPPPRAHRSVVKTHRMEAGRIRATCSPAIDPEAVRAWIASDAGKLLVGADGGPRVERASLGGTPVIVKREARSAARRIASALTGRPGRSARAFRIGLDLLEHGVPAARPLVLLEERIFGLERSAVVLEEAPGVTLRELHHGQAARAGPGGARPHEARCPRPWPRPSRGFTRPASGSGT